MSLFKPWTGLYVGLAVASFVITVLALVIPPMAGQEAPDPPSSGPAYWVRNDAGTPAAIQLRLGEDGIDLGTATLEPGELTRFPTTDGSALLWVQARWVDAGSDVGMCQDTRGDGYVILLEPDPHRITCAGRPAR